MAAKLVNIPPIGPVKLYKRRDARSIKISLNRGDEVRVTLPAWLPYRAGVEYARSKADWIERHRQPYIPLAHGSQIGKAHRLYYYCSPRTTMSTRVTATEIRVRHPTLTNFQDTAVQTLAKRASLRALKQEAGVLLPQRLAQLAVKYNFSYTGVSIKNLRSRWGSCSQQKYIALNIFLMQLPWQLIDYVLLHELTHTKYLNHSKEFWNHLESCLPNYKALRNDLKNYQPTI